MESLESFVRRNACTTRERYDSAKAELISQLDQAHRLTSERLYDAAFSQALHVWWDMVLIHVDSYGLDITHAVRHVHAWVTRCLAGESSRTRPDTPFDYAVAHASQAAACRFLSDIESLTPCVSDDCEISLYDSRDALDYPDRRIFLGPRGGVRVERC
ncbi:hypothetical protein ACQP1V_29165 [Microtetraspora malaysiensis]|uniref:hypothetical protein n=1 Tax=Microtetraspora malaysiensis TaxID=161358 RepID=UPI003D902008